MKEKLSVIIPVYNTEKYLEKCINSILNQTYKNLEVILINDGSTDSSGIICEKMKGKDKRIILIHSENRGVSVARNIGISRATGKYISFVDSDDYISSDMYTDMIKNINDVSMPICGYNYMDDIGNKIGEKNAYITECEILKKDFFLLCENFILNSPVNKIFHADIIKKYNIKFDNSLSLGEDLIFVLDYIKYIDKFIIINKHFYQYLVTNSYSLSQKYRSDFLDIQKRIIEETYNKFKEYNIDFEPYKERFYTRSLDLIMQAMNNTMSKDNDLSIREKFKYNNKIIKSKQFEQLTYGANLSMINSFTRFGFKMNSYEFIYYSNKILNIIKRRKR